MDIYVVSMSWLLSIVLQRTLGCEYLFELWFSLDICPGVGLLDHIVLKGFLWTILPLLSKQFYSPYFSISTLAIPIIIFVALHFWK